MNVDLNDLNSFSPLHFENFAPPLNVTFLTPSLHSPVTNIFIFDYMFYYLEIPTLFFVGYTEIRFKSTAQLIRISISSETIT